MTKRWGLHCIQMCLVDSCAVCYVSALHYLSGFDPSGAELLSKHHTCRNRKREQQPWKMVLCPPGAGWLHETTWDFGTFYFQCLCGFRPIAAICTHWFWCWLQVFLPAVRFPRAWGHAQAQVIIPHSHVFQRLDQTIEVTEPRNKCPVVHRNSVELIFDTPTWCSRDAGRLSMFGWCFMGLQQGTQSCGRLGSRAESTVKACKVATGCHLSLAWDTQLARKR